MTTVMLPPGPSAPHFVQGVYALTAPLRGMRRLRPDLYQWIPFGGGTRRCVGAAFATMEMNVVLRVMLRDFTLMPTTERAERWHSRGIANAPAKGGRAIVRRRVPREMPQAAATAAGARS